MPVSVHLESVSILGLICIVSESTEKGDFQSAFFKI